ncbi:MAG: Holliday junction branch migration protein RuvA [Patescibacteria group bacterium]|nr:Holliday junction branch migration protein RuvA [Patescibacteria group bacterium]
MIAKITGTISEKGERYVIIDVSGLGYKVFITDDAAHTLQIDRETSLFTHLVVREDALDLYGFTSKKEKEFFTLLIGISGIGPKSALNILSLVSIEALVSSIRSGSVAHLVKVSGIGKKTAEKIVLELRDKLGGVETSAENAAEMSSDLDAIEALKSLGYDIDEAREALKKIDSNITDTGAKVKAALKRLG